MVLQDCSERVEIMRTNFLPSLNDKINAIASSLALRVIDIDNHSRKWSIVIQGLKGEAHEDHKETRKTCLRLAKESLGIDDADGTQVAACHRLNQTADAPVILRFCDLDDRDKWLQNAKRLRDDPRKISLSPDLSPVLRPIKKDLMAKRRSLSDDLKKRSSIRYLKSWPYVELKVNGHRHCESDITKNDIIKQFTDVNPVLKFDISDK